MKTKYNIFKILLLIFPLFWTVSCEDFLTEDPKGRLASETFFANESDLKASLNALYYVVAEAQIWSGNTGDNFLAGDDLSTNPSSNKQPLREHDEYNVSENNAWLPDLWSSRWRIVKAANFIINNAAKTPNVSEEIINSAIGQASYWRAYAYFYLVTTWGPVPIMLKEEINYEATLQTEEEVYKLIIEDLKRAEAGCPVQYSEEPYARNGVNIAVSQGAVKATMSYVYMSMAGWPLNKGTEYYQLAANKAKEVIDGVENKTYYYTLLDEYWKVYSWTYNDKNAEVLLGVYYNKDQLGNGTVLGDILADLAQQGWGDTNGEIKFWKNFPDGPRKKATYFPKIMLADGNLYDWWYDTNPPSREVVAPVFMKSAEGAIRFTEFDYTDPTPPPGDGDKMHQVVRLSEVYCWYAEAIGRSGQINAKAIEVLNKVRNRADGQESNIYSMSMTPKELAEAAYNEHGWEMAGYEWGGLATREGDMFRMYRIKDHFEFRKENPLIEVAPGVFRKEAVPVTGTWSDDKMYNPYPYSDVNLNPNLKR